MSYKRWLFIAISLFGIGLVLGLSTSSGSAGLLSEELTALEEFADILTPLPQSSILAIIFMKNVSALLISFVLSPIFCLVPVLALTVNGWLVGLVSAMVIEEKSLGYLLAGLLPHGIFEVPALIMGEAVALSFGTTAFLALFSKEKGNLVLPNFKQNSRYLIAALGLLLIAAIIETYITPLFLSRNR